MLANRLKRVIGKCINEAQSAFIPGRLITDNILIAYETFHTLRTRKMGKSGAFAIKLDMSKAYDRVEWSFLNSMMMAMGFNRPWIDLILKTVSSPTYQVTINGAQGRIFRATRGIRQGDPLSPLLFVICSEGLSTLIHAAALNGHFKGIRSCKDGPRIHHLLYADDSFIFSEASLYSATIIKQILDTYAACSGQMINFDKSSILFSPNTDDDLRLSISNILQIQVSNNPEKYLGFPIAIGRNKRKEFQYIIDKGNKLCHKWSSRNLSKGGKEVFLKAIFQALPSFIIMCILLPSSFWDDFHKSAARFLWRHKSNKRAIHWSTWIEICKPKSVGGLNFKDMKIFNPAMVAKQVWRLLQEKETLAFKVLSAKYFPDGNVLNSKLGSNPSTTWKSIFSTIQIVQQGLIWRIGDGKKVRIGSDPWIPGNPFGLPLTPAVNYQHLTFVSQLLTNDGTHWNMEILNSVFIPRDVNKIRMIPLSAFCPPDTPSWRLEPSGNFTVRSTYKFLNSMEFVPFISDEITYEIRDIFREEILMNEETPMSINSIQTNDNSLLQLHIFKLIWKLRLPKKVQIHLWRLSKGFLPTRAKLRERHILQESYCTRCGNGVESLAHVFYWCVYAEEVWLRILPNCPPIITEIGFNSWLLELLSLPSVELIFLASTALWKLWEYRNRAVHDNRGYVFDFQAQEISSLATKFYQVAYKVTNIPIMAQSHWMPPPTNFFRVNFDASFKASTGLGAVGVVIRNETGELIATLAAPIANIESPLAAEAFASIMALRLALFFNLPKIILEGDNKILMSKLRNQEIDISNVGTFVNDAKILTSNFEDFRCLHIPRESNTLADQYARLGYSYQDTAYWIENFPFAP